MKFTENFRLRKPSQEDHYDIEHHNENMDGIDTVLGDLTVTVKDIANTIYPVGAIYMSVNNVNPATLFGGTWERFADGRVLMGSNTAAGVESGSATAQLPSHVHGMGAHTHTLPNHVHRMNAHTHTLPNHVHGIGTHTHSLPNHVHTQTPHNHGMAHLHRMASHVHRMASHSHTVGAHTHALNDSGNAQIGVDFNSMVFAMRTGAATVAANHRYEGTMWSAPSSLNTARASLLRGVTGAMSAAANTGTNNNPTGGPRHADDSAARNTTEGARNTADDAARNSTDNSAATNTGNPTANPATGAPSANNTANPTTTPASGAPSTANTENPTTNPASGAPSTANTGAPTTTPAISIMQPSISCFIWRRVA